MEVIPRAVVSKARKAVSKDKYRYQDEWFDLDLTYITPRIIAMGLPGKKVEKLWRNNVDDVAQFLFLHHHLQYMVFNLSGEKYDYTKFEERVKEWGFPDHATCPLYYLTRIVDDICKFLLSDRKNVAVVHCLAGRGRTGTVISCVMLKLQLFDNAESSLKYFADTRSRKSSGVLTPSQRRYVEYYHKIIRNKIPPPFGNPENLVFHRIIVAPCPSVPTTRGWTPVMKVFTLGTMDVPEETIYSDNNEVNVTFYGNEQSKCIIDIDAFGRHVKGDIQVKFYHKAKNALAFAKLLKIGGLKKTEIALAKFPLICMFRFSFHTSFVYHSFQHQLERQRKGEAEKESKSGSRVHVSGDEIHFVLTKPELDAMFSGVAHMAMVPDDINITCVFTREKRRETSNNILASAAETKPLFLGGEGREEETPAVSLTTSGRIQKVVVGEKEVITRKGEQFRIGGSASLGDLRVKAGNPLPHAKNADMKPRSASEKPSRHPLASGAPKGRSTGELARRFEIGAVRNTQSFRVRRDDTNTSYDKDFTRAAVSKSVRISRSPNSSGKTDNPSSKEGGEGKVSPTIGTRARRRARSRSQPGQPSLPSSAPAVLDLPTDDATAKQLHPPLLPVVVGKIDPQPENKAEEGRSALDN